MKLLLNVFELFRRLSLSYSIMFMLVAELIENGTTVFKQLVEVLNKPEYSQILDRYKASALHLIAAVSEFKAASTDLRSAAFQNQEDFLFLHNFIQSTETKFSKPLEEAFKSTSDFIKEMDNESKDFVVIPKFIRESGEYMDLVNLGKVDVSENDFLAAVNLVYGMGGKKEVEEKLRRVQNDLNKQGWSSIRSKWEGEYRTLVFWGDSLSEDETPAVQDTPPENIEETLKSFNDSFEEIKPKA